MLTTTLVAIVPSAGALFLFWVAIRAIVQADRRERAAQARLEAAEDAAAASVPGVPGVPGSAASGGVPGPAASGGAVNGAPGTDAGATVDQSR